MSNIILTEKDIELLSHGVSASTKSETIKKITETYKELGALGFDERKIAEDIFRIMITDVEEVVREVLADSLKSMSNIPRDIVEKIVNDVENVSVSFIKEYQGFSDEDLISILQFNNFTKQKAVVSRKNVSGHVSHYVVEKCEEDLVSVLLENKGSEIFDNTYNLIVDKYQNSENIKEGLVTRATLPVFVADRILDNLSSSLQKKLIGNNDISVDIIANFLEVVKDRVTFAMFKGYASEQEISEAVRDLYESNKLNDKLLIRVLCLGNLTFFEYGVSFVTKRKLKDVRSILYFNKDDYVIRNLLREANISVNYFNIVLIALRVILDMEFKNERTQRHTWSKKVLERMLTFTAVNSRIEELDLKYFMSKI